MREAVAGVKGGVIPFHGNGAAARRYVEADRSGADEYYLRADNAIAEYVAFDGKGEVTAARSLSPDEYEGWVDWHDPITGEPMGTPRKPAEGTKGSPLFCDMTINSPKSLSVAAALHPEVSEALDQAQQDALGEIRRWLGQHSVTRVGPREAREIVPIEQMQVVGIGHKTSRAGDPHRHIHMQIGTRIWAAGKWRALDTAALFKQQGAIHAMGTAVIAAHPELAETLSRHGLTLDPVSGEVAELEPFNAVMSKRSAQINRNLDHLEAEWQTEHPGETPGPVVTARMQGTAWAHQRPGKKPLGVVAAETALRDQLTASIPEQEPERPDVTEAAQAAGLDEGQTLAAAAVASTDPLVIVEGAAGSGKTTMLRTAIEVAAEHGRSTRVVAPTKRAAQIAQEELGIPATSVAALAYAHGWRWNADGVWTRLNRGDTDPMTGGIYTGPPPEAVLSRGGRVVVDEAGMIDQDTAHALLTITAEASATVALVGDRAQLPAVGRGGVLDMAAQIRGRTYDMSELHRFTDAEYAALTLAMRDRSSPGDVFDRLATMHLVTLHADDDAAREHITDHARDGEAITVATNDEATALNERIRAGRVEAGKVSDTVTVTGSDGLSIGAGDLIQTRRNDSDVGVANRQQWIVQHVNSEDGTVYAREVGSGRKNPRTVALPVEYVGENAHLSYAATAYGVQGATVSSSHTALSEATSAAGVYVGMTRGRHTNRLHIVAEDMADARAQFIEAMKRDPAGRGLDHATAQAAEAVRGFVADGPVRLVTEELARLDHEAEQAERAAERWEQTAARFDAQRATHQAEDNQSAAVLRKAEDSSEQVRAEVATPLTTQAETDGAAYLDAVADEAAARGRLATVGRFGRRRARIEHQAATERAQSLRGHVSGEWGTTPANPDRLPEWAGQVAATRAEADPRVTEVVETVDAATAGREMMRKRHRQERTALLVSEYGAEHAQAARYGMRRTTNPDRQARDAKNRAAATRAEADELRSLPITEAARLIETKHAAQEQARERAAQRERQLHDPFEHDLHRHELRREGPTRGL